jgi:hypothetical protein
MKPKQPGGPPMTLGNMRELGVRANERQYAFRGAAFRRLREVHRPVRFGV